MGLRIPTGEERKGSVFDRTGKKITYTQKVAQTMNWYRRCLMGLIAQLKFSSGYFITRESGYSDMSNERRVKLRELLEAKDRAIAEVENVLKLIEEFQKAPIDLKREERKKATGKDPRKPAKAPPPAFRNLGTLRQS